MTNIFIVWQGSRDILTKFLPCQERTIIRPYTEYSEVVGKAARRIRM